MFHHFRQHWRRFRPYRMRHRRYAHKQFKHRDVARDRHYVSQREDVQFVCRSTDFFECAEEQVVSMLQRRPEVHDLDRDISRLRKKFARTNNAHDGLVALLAQAPRAVLAQIQMDQHPHGYRNRQERLYELIDFNDTLVATVMVLDDANRVRFSDATKQCADRICKRVGAPCFTDEQWTAIIRGLTREIALYYAAVNNGFHAHMTDRSQDAMGIDMQVLDPEDGRYANIDVKTPSSFRHRLDELVHEGRITEGERLAADERSYVRVTNGHGNNRIETVLLCILPDIFGDLSHFRFIDEAPARDMLNRVIRECGLSDGHFGHLY
ncbi:MAG TPA: hypothetical protein PKV96_02835 [Candidatus Saccharimonas sp.]|nr:hypothetical protein [Candidatus Saccharimonas sp.]